jgi:ABC-2 type transport system ATP-binding protein
MMSGQTAVQAHELHKDFGDIYAVKDVSFQIRTGEVFSLLGPNGAGKSTTISIICGLLKPDKGDAVVFGKSILRDPLAVKSALGVVPQDIALYEDLSARENLFFWGRMYGLQGAVLRKRVDEVLEIIGLAERQKDRVGKYSGGMKRRLNVGVALLHEPEIIIMDEPTVGIDPQSRRNILDSVMSLNQQGMTVLYTTHYMEEAQELSDQIVILDQGEIIASGTHNELVKIVGELDRIDVTLNTDSVRMFDAWQAIQGVRNIDAQNGTVSLLVEDSNLVLPLLFESASQSGARITSLEVEEPNLETVFLHLTGKALRD